MRFGAVRGRSDTDKCRPSPTHYASEARRLNLSRSSPRGPVWLATRWFNTSSRCARWSD